MRPVWSGLLAGWLAIGGAANVVAADLFRLPTANQALFEPGGEERFFVGTVGKPWTSGTFGCVRSDGWQIHEGLDIRCLQRDQRGEPTDPILATAEGTVAYINRKSSLSNYGIYLILRHVIQGLEIYSVYSHLREVRADLRPGVAVKAGEPVGVMGRTANTREGISRERAHLHFELNLLINERFAQWYKKTNPKQRNDHGDWNGQNLLGLDPRQVFLEQRRLGADFNLVQLIRSQRELCRVVVRDTDFPFLRRYPQLLRANPVAQRDGAAGYEIALNFNGVPIELIPRAESELKSRTRIQLLSVNATEKRLNPGRRLVTENARGWRLTTTGENLLDLLCY
jgi:murein DD-endopeptidase MepM/ murein hydrolase activator NlpD